MFTHFYLIKFQYLGFRYHGWQKQPNLKTVHLMVDKTLNYILDDGKKFKTLGASRTDAMVSANDAAFELFLAEPLNDVDEFISQFNYYLPPDIRATSVEKVAKEFNIIQHPKIKEYHYLFAHGQKSHPFCASIMTTFRDHLDIELMTKGALLFEGTHNFRSFCSKVSENRTYTREILTCQLIENTKYSANFFPDSSYLLQVKAEGFGHNQIRLMMGALVKLGQHVWTLDDISKSLEEDSTILVDTIAPASGLLLDSMTFD